MRAEAIVKDKKRREKDKIRASGARSTIATDKKTLSHQATVRHSDHFTLYPVVERAYDVYYQTGAWLVFGDEPQ